MARHVWNIFSDSNTNLWTAWIKAHYLSEVSFWCVHPPSICSWNWRKMLNLRDILRSHFFHAIGDGESTSLWFDNWHPHGPLIVRWGQGIIATSGIHAHALVSHIIGDAGWCWPSSSHPSLLEIQWDSLCVHPCTSRKDSIRWLPNPSGISLLPLLEILFGPLAQIFLGLRWFGIMPLSCKLALCYGWLSGERCPLWIGLASLFLKPTRCVFFVGWMWILMTTCFLSANFVKGFGGWFFVAVGFRG
ncbi:uncharacterized protein Pyn_22910 [Prunus yedoensis var. nudiflora]|uniref:Reverse transcriptase zinc-binding domain-containing protein n=1 Tax=Prunus yedoensis var. nudiflora TaxID=2094558 RepID=A0A314YKE8_PRUYE|nr:uncharacterized protein Pyn_22910 [Prunus yedoensis var. nudiflora]